ncbi:MAG: FG-GAP-like repeat-containing protein [Gelidibacter sp.]
MKIINYRCRVLILFAVYCPAFSQLFFENKSIELGIVNSGGVSNGIDPGGLSFFDYDNDGWDDITIGGKSSTQPLRFFKNNFGTFVEEIFNFSVTGDVKQVIWVDYDNDGDNDFFVAVANGINKLFNNDGSFNFTDVTVAAGFPNASLKTFGASFGDYDNDGFLDVFISNLDYSGIKPNYLYHNNGNGTFTNVSQSAGIGNASNFSFCSAFFDFNNDGFQDIYVINDRMTTRNVLYRNNGNGTFTDVSVASGSNIQMNAMSTAVEDYNYDGWLDIYITNTSEGNYLLKNNADGTFTNLSMSTGTILNHFSWGANFFDADNDMDLDLYASTAELNVSAFFECLANGMFQVPTNAGFNVDTFHSYSNVIGDINNDGYVDIFVNNDAPQNSSLWKNSGGTNNWLKVKLTGVQSNRNGIGSWIEVSVNGQLMNRYTLCGESFLGQNSGTEFFGVGDATAIDYIKVKWLSGIEDILTDVIPNQTLNIIEGSTALSTVDFEVDDIRIFPNPTGGMVYFKTNANFKIDILDVSGRKIVSKFVNQTNPSIDMSSFSKGIYFLNIQINDKLVTKKIVLN